MKIGFVTINTLPSKEQEIYDELIKKDFIIELYGCFGQYDLIAKVKAENFDNLGKIVVEKIRTIKGVNETETLIVAEYENMPSYYRK
ncbi:MAG: Lrp/AsnC ligand binding domain-containing protein [Nanoarchaeota archaeon]|nr:Lrp/AsnC ligand binding domain-containing protein [Nanoarchaeota archaeon]